MCAVLVVNAGSTSLKMRLVAEDGETSEPAALGAVEPATVEAVAHRVVHGGERFRDPVVVDAAVERELEGLAELAPLHNRPALDALAEARRALPGLPHVAVFDTAFHATLAPEALVYALPRRLREEAGIRRFGFHGLSVQWAAERVAAERLVVCHLGGGCSVTAVRAGRSLDTTMGFTPLEGVPMATRSGSVDPGALLHLLRGGLAVGELDDVLEQRSGLLGLSGVSGSVEELERSREAGAAFALRVFARRVAQAVAAMAVALEGLDALVFTAGVGEHSAAVRAAVCAPLRFLGVRLDEGRNASARPDAEIGARGGVRIAVVRAREELIAAREARRVLKAAARGGW